MTTGGGWIAEKVKLLAAAASTSEAGIMMITDYVYCDFTVLLVLLSEILKFFVQLTVPTEVRPLADVAKREIISRSFSNPEKRKTT